MINTREGRSPEHTRLIYFIRSNKQAWPFASVMFGRLDILAFTHCLAPAWLQEEAEAGGELLVHDMKLSAFECELSDAHDDLLELFSLT